MNAITPASARPDARLLTRYDGRAPRYTSYPTALSFSPQVDETLYRSWLSELDPSTALSLYIHVPFCQRLCWYCGCNTRVVRKRDLISSYNQLVIDELGLLQAALPDKMGVGQVHLGGGTPNMLSRDDMTNLFGAIRQVFKVAPEAEIAAELDPASLTRDWVRAAAHHGLSRASLGVQDLTPEVQKAVNRIEAFSVVEQAAGWLREAGIRSLNLDLMYGLPNQTTDGMLATLAQVISLRPERLALFGYAHVPWARPHQKLIPTERLPGAAERLDQSEAAADWLASEGYVRIGLDHFAREDDSLAIAARAGKLHRNFQGYTTDPHEVLLGVGASSIGRLPQGFAQNIAGEAQWRAAVAAGRLPITRGVQLTDDDRFRGDIIERLMCDLKVDLAAVCANHGRSLGDLDPALEAIKPLIADAIVKVDGAVVTVTDPGRPFLRSVCQLFDVRSNDPGAHSRVV
ncbi:MAG: oxygen-independent coproporphyrinogen III oxidase [Alphaproteobacteria bacterium]|nr:oxygen-independent coproporphyrinogen III oxidase [Alphaproteobacteria bacterium]